MIWLAMTMVMAAPGCTAVVPPPAALAAWSQRVPAGPGPLVAGQGIDVALRPEADVRFVVAPPKPAAGYAAVVPLQIEQAGTYRVALGVAAWVDLIAARKAVASSGHDHGPACTGIRKLVDFALQPGAHAIQISGSPVASAGLLVTRVR